MTNINPAVPARLEEDLKRRQVTARYRASDGTEEVLAKVWYLENRPHLVGETADGRAIAVYLAAVTEVAVNDAETMMHWNSSENCYLPHHPVVVSHWRRAPWGELVRLVPD